VHEDLPPATAVVADVAHPQDRTTLLVAACSQGFPVGVADA
jgi:hypothetical protein